MREDVEALVTNNGFRQADLDVFGATEEIDAHVGSTKV